MVRGMFSQHTLGHVIPIKHGLNTLHPVRPFMAPSKGYFWLDNAHESMDMTMSWNLQRWCDNAITSPCREPRLWGLPRISMGFLIKWPASVGMTLFFMRRWNTYLRLHVHNRVDIWERCSDGVCTLTPEPGGHWSTTRRMFAPRRRELALKHELHCNRDIRSAGLSIIS